LLPSGETAPIKSLLFKTVPLHERRGSEIRHFVMAITSDYKIISNVGGLRR
jgi:hypothetical protein